jgi:hypothetical protein
MEHEKHSQTLQETVGWLDLFTQMNLRRRLFVVLGLHIAQQFSGINAVSFFLIGKKNTTQN